MEIRMKLDDKFTSTPLVRKVTVTDVITPIAPSSANISEMMIYVKGASVNYAGLKSDGTDDLTAGMPFTTGERLSFRMGTDGVNTPEIHLFADAGQTCDVLVFEYLAPGKSQVIINPVIVSIALNPSGAMNLNPNPGALTLIQAIATYDDASTLDVSHMVVWNDDNQAALQITATDPGMAGQFFTPVAQGVANVSATLDGVTSDIAVITVTDGYIVITPPDPTVAVSGTVQLTATLYTNAGTTQTDVTSLVSWSTSNPAITIDATGLVTGVSVTGYALVVVNYTDVEFYAATTGVAVTA